MTSDKQTWKKIVDFLGVIVPSVTFFIIFITFMISIISRYVLKAPVTWTYEISVLGYMWTMFFGVGKAMENDEHVVFALVYDKLNYGSKRRTLIVYNVILAVLLCVVVVPGLKAASISTMSTGVLHIPYKIAFAPFFYMLVDVIVRTVLKIVHLVKIGEAGFTAEEEEKERLAKEAEAREYEALVKQMEEGGALK